MDVEEGAIIFNDGRKVLILFYSAINILQQVQLKLSKCKCAFFFSGSGPFFGQLTGKRLAIYFIHKTTFTKDYKKKRLVVN